MFAEAEIGAWQVPSTAAEAAKTKLVGMFEKKSLKNLLEFALDYEESDASTHKGHDLSKISAERGRAA